jgi:hypothetical protein
MVTRIARRSPVRIEPFEGRILFSTWIDTSNRATVAQFYQTQYVGSANIDPGWTGSYTTGDAGTTTAAFKQAVMNRIDYYRSMAGIDNIIGFDATFNQKDQQAALMMSANKTLNHTPPADWKFYTADGAAAAGKSNLALGANGSDAIDLYMQDYNQDIVGHRRWLLYPQTKHMGTGDVPGGTDGVTTYAPANALWTVNDAEYFDPRPATRQPYVAWPAPGYDPFEVVPQLWSFSYAGADFANADVTVTRGGNPVTVSKKPVQDVAGEITLVWGMPDPIDATETVYNVQVTNVLIKNVAQNFSYTVTSFDPTVAVNPPVLQSTAIGLPGNTTQRSMVKQVSFTFDRPVTIAAGALSMLRLFEGGGSVGVNALNAPTLSNGGATWTYTLIPNTDYTEASGSLQDGIYSATLDASKVTAGGVAMAGPNPTTTFHRLFGDVNGSKSVNALDYNAFRPVFGKNSGQAGYDAAFDFDGNGTINALDFNQFRSRFGKSFAY